MLVLATEALVVFFFFSFLLRLSLANAKGKQPFMSMWEAFCLLLLLVLLSSHAY